MIGLLLICLLCVGYMYLVFMSEIRRIVVHLLDLKEDELIRKTNLSASVKQIILQEPLNNNYVLKGFIQEIVNDNLPISENFEIPTVAVNYHKTGKIDYDMSSWYSTPEVKAQEDLTSPEIDFLKIAVALHYPFKNILLDQLDSGIGVYHHIYYIFQGGRMLFQYPAYDNDILTKTYGEGYPCADYFPDSGNMEFYDGRCRNFYKQAVKDKFDPSTYGPYQNPSVSNNFFVLTLSQAIDKDGEVHGVLSHDINLNFKGFFDQYLVPRDANMHYFITNFEGTLFKHSEVTIKSTNETITMAEFSKEDTSLKEEPQTKEAQNFRDKMLTLMKNLTHTELTSYTKFGRKYRASMTPMKLMIFTEPGTKNPGPDQFFIFTQVIDEESFVSFLTDQSELLLFLLIWTSIFIAVFILLILLTSWALAKITTRALKPIQILNTKVSILVKTNGELNLENTKVSMNSYEAQKMFEVFSELITTKKFTSNTILKNNDAIAIMEYAEAYTVFKDNKKVQGICMTNIGHIYQKLKDYDEAAKRYREAADLSLLLINDSESDDQTISENWKLYCKRKYYEIICLFKHTQDQEKSVIEEEMPKVEKDIDSIKKLLSERMKRSISDILIMLNLYSSKCLLMTRRLISSERDLHLAVMIFKEDKIIIKEDRPDIPIIPRCILRQRILLQKALILKAYSRTQESALLLTKLLKCGKVYDPGTRKEALETLYSIMANCPEGNLIEKHPETRNIEMMLQLFQSDKNKNIILCVDSINCHMINTKKRILCEIFDCLNSQDNISLISMNKKVNRVFSLAQKQKNTTQLFNQLKHLQTVDKTKLFLVKGIQKSVEEIKTYGNDSRHFRSFSNYIICICSHADNSSIQEKYRQYWEKLEHDIGRLQINFVFITVGGAQSQEFKNIKKLVNFNDNTIFLNITPNTKFEKSIHQRKSDSGSRIFNRESNKNLEKIRMLMSNISNIKSMDENLIFETF
ncbi:unnamed protein product [Moneuplotes crassus]|uniref:VWFA domain-containing protein n=1 Tax=Euplotes crassus TaxID=5936 RepID=A0AAD2D6I1_EUPCR|nr:unnamed protein product [Moneuplotes crassus]